MEKKFDLENFVKQNETLFNLEEPNEGHFDRFKAKLESQTVKKNRFVLKSMRYAAVVVLLITGGLIINNTTNIFQGTETLSENFESDITEDFSEVSNFYDSQIDQKLSDISSLECKQGDGYKVNVNEDLNELTSSYEELQNEFRNDPDNPIIKNAIIDNFNMRLNILDLIMNQLKNYC